METWLLKFINNFLIGDLDKLTLVWIIKIIQDKGWVKATFIKILQYSCNIQNNAEDTIGKA